MNPQQERSWWSRNWKWFVPVGCLGAILLIGASIALIWYFVLGMMKSSDVYRHAVARAKVHPSVQMSLGTPIDGGMLVTGDISISGPSGQADLAIPISGPNGKATIYVVAFRSGGQWTFTTLVVVIGVNNEIINLLE